MNKRNLTLTIFILFKFVLQYLLIHPEYELQRDEYLHLDQANHLAWGYLSVPPVTSWISYIIKLLGNGIFWVKFFPALFGALTIVVAWKTVEALKGNYFALVLSAVCITFSVLPRVNILYQPNSLDILCWTFFYYCFIKYVDGYKAKWLYIGALAFAIGFLNKYNIVFMMLGFLPALLLTTERKVFTQPRLYFAAVFGLVLILPNLIWQYQNGFPVFYHLKELSETQLVHVDRIGFFRSQLYFFFGSVFVIVAALIAMLWYQPFRKYKTFFWSFIFTLIIFVYFKAKDYYAIGLYPVYLAFGSVFLSRFFERKWKPVYQTIAILIPVGIFIAVFDVSYPDKSPEYITTHADKYRKLGLLRWEDGKDHHLPQDYADMLGWKELAYKVDSVYNAIPNDYSTLILCDNYGQAGAINYYTRKGLKAVSFNADYINWFELDEIYKNLIRVKDKSEVFREYEQTAPYFESASIADSITNKYAREYGTVIFSFINAKVNINERIEQEIQEEKKWK